MPGFHKVPSPATALRTALAAAALLLYGACASPSLPCPANFAQVDVTVGADPGDPLEMSPSHAVTVYLGSVKPEQPDDPSVKRQVCWVVHDLPDGQTLHIQRKPGQDDLFPALERTVRAPRTTAKSGVPHAKGCWIYELWVTAGDGDEKLHYTDPEVIIRDKWGP